MENWKVWDDEKKYGDLFFKRAIGEFPEMESSKALAKQILPIVENGNLIADIGCGAGHYLRSIDSLLTKEFHYIVIDQTSYYIEKAKEAFSNPVNRNTNRLSTKFLVGDIFNIPLDDNSIDITICNNVLLHLPSIKKPIAELLRITKKTLVIRTLIGEHTLRVKQVHKPEEFDENGEPSKFHFHNIYSRSFLENLLNHHKIQKFKFILDNDYNVSAFNNKSNYIDQRPENTTTIMNGMQINTYIIQPWSFLIIEK